MKKSNFTEEQIVGILKPVIEAVRATSRQLWPWLWVALQDAQGQPAALRQDTAVARVYCELKLNRLRRGKKQLPARIREPLIFPPQRNETRSADFMSDALWPGRRFRTFNVIDDYNREAL